MSPRSGYDLLTNSRTGFDISTTVKAEASKKAGGAADSQFGEGTSSKAAAAKDVYENAIKPPPVGERYSGNFWSASSVLAGDAGFEKLKAALNDAAAMSEAVRKEKEDDLRKRSGAVSTLMATWVPIGTVAGAALYAFTEGAIALGNWLYKDDSDSQENRDRADRAVKKLWGEWMISPPSFAPDLERVNTYANRVEGLLRVLEISENEGEPWRARWLAAMESGIKSSVPAVRDVSRLGWIPVDGSLWLGAWWYPNGKGFLWKAPHGDLGFGVTKTITHKPGFLSAERETVEQYIVPTFEEMASMMDRYAAGVGVMVAVAHGVAIEPVVEAAVAASRQWLLELGPDSSLAGHRLKGVFMEAERAALTAPKNPMLVKRQIVDSRIERFTETVKQQKEKMVQSLLLSPKTVQLLVEADKLLSLEDRGFRYFQKWKTLKKTPKVVLTKDKAKT